ncbi:hypothetical protein BST61_g10368 [Cercospora zeina]
MYCIQNGTLQHAMNAIRGRASEQLNTLSHSLRTVPNTQHHQQGGTKNYGQDHQFRNRAHRNKVTYHSALIDTVMGEAIVPAKPSLRNVMQGRTPHLL